MNIEHTDLWKRIPGANIDEEVLLSPGKVKIRYQGREIYCISAENSEESVNVEVQYCTGERISWRTTRIDITSSMLWGIPLSFDCMHLFAPQVGGGVCCLLVKDGSICWKTKSRAHFKQIMVNPVASLCCACGEHDIVVLDIETGAEISKKRISLNNHFTVLGTNRILVEATSTKWCVLNSESLETIEVISKKDLNTHQGQEIWRRIFKDWSL